MNDLRAAADFIQNGDESGLMDPRALDSDSKYMDRYYDAANDLARAWLAEHDETPVDEAWLRSVGFDTVCARLACGELQMTTHNGEWNVWHKWDHHPHGSTRLINGVNRGQLRMLATVLGIPLRATP